MITRYAVSLASALAVAAFGASPVQAAEDPMFEHVMTIGSEGEGEAQFLYVEDFAFDGNGNFIVTDAAHALGPAKPGIFQTAGVVAWESKLFFKT